MNRTSLSGLIDIIAVQQPNGDIHSTPFYIRFGRNYTMKPKNKIVTIFVNNKKVNVQMILGSAGEAYFLTTTLTNNTNKQEQLDLKKQETKTQNSPKIEKKKNNLSEEEPEETVFSLLEEMNEEIEEDEEIKKKKKVLYNRISESFDIELLIEELCHDYEKLTTILEKEKNNQEKKNTSQRMKWWIEFLKKNLQTPNSPQKIRLYREDSSIDEKTIGSPRSGKFSKLRKRSQKGLMKYVTLVSENENNSLDKKSLYNSKIEISLCGSLTNLNEENIEENFRKFEISQEDYFQNPSLIFSEDLIFKIDDKYYPFYLAIQTIMGTLLFNQSLNLEVDFSSTVNTKKEISKFSPKNRKKFQKKRKKIEKNFRKQDLKKKKITPTSEQLKQLNLNYGENIIKFQIKTHLKGIKSMEGKIFLWKKTDRIIISDIDGTITKSDIKGIVLPLFGKTGWTQQGIAELYQKIIQQGYKIMYLSSRAISQIKMTRKYINNIKQDNITMPAGPIIMSPNQLFKSFTREVIRRKPHEFKIPCLQNIRDIFLLKSKETPFYGGFGNRDTDLLSYNKVGIPKKKVFIINSKGQLTSNIKNTESLDDIKKFIEQIFPSNLDKTSQTNILSSEDTTESSLDEDIILK
ncbi:lipin [Anaeramoeba flamelloides]|uniref:phosphatidate phosphatase n=1 Tax=Anaeramoeba flamelloides TaxID=1746091 RepID=A0ABQ8YW91_9EUKA|nr:lipin [Anaeramoeba flamelloides]